MKKLFLLAVLFFSMEFTINAQESCPPSNFGCVLVEEGDINFWIPMPETRHAVIHAVRGHTNFALRQLQRDIISRQFISVGNHYGPIVRDSLLTHHYDVKVDAINF